jgi:negative regulator of sigma E activity
MLYDSTAVHCCVAAMRAASAVARCSILTKLNICMDTTSYISRHFTSATTVMYAHYRCEAGLRESLLQQLGSLASIVRQHIRAFLPSIFQLVVDYWQDNLEQVQYTDMQPLYIAMLL